MIPVTEFGVYVHIPFCIRRCDYCAFATWADRDHLIGRYVDALRTEIDRAVEAGVPTATSVFFGGGTPSLLTPDQLGAMLGSLPIALDAEITVECNPDTVDADRLGGYRAHGVNRISFGVQSMVNRVLVSLGRSHDRDNVLRAVDAARAVGIDNLNVDLIYGAVTESPDDWLATLDDVLALAPPHLSAYGLTAEPGTPLAADPARHPDEDDQADKYEIADERLTRAGLASYEISNWARPAMACRHNELYWRQGDYLGFGSAAHSHRRSTHGTPRRSWNVRTPERFIELIEAGRSAEAGGEDLTVAQSALERLQLALRTAQGVPANAFNTTDADELLDMGLLAPEGDRLRLTRRGRLLANAVALRLRADDHPA